MRLFSTKPIVMIVCLGIYAMCSIPGHVVAGELGHYVPGVANIRDFAVPAAPGYYYLQYNLHYTTDTYKNHDGKTVDNVNLGPITADIDANVDSYAIQPTFLSVTDIKFLGATYAPYIGVPIVNMSIQAA